MLSSGLRFRGVFRQLRCFLLVVLVVARSHGQTPEIAGTLPEDYFPVLKNILQTAVKQSPEALRQQINVEMREAQVYGADSQRLPSLGGDMRYAGTQTAISSDQSTKSRDAGFFYSFGLSQNLFRWGEMKHRSEIARIDVLIAKQSYEDAYRSLAVELRRGFLALIVRKTQLRHAQFDLQLAESDLQLAREKLDRGTTSPGEVASRTLTRDERRTRVMSNEVDFAAERRRFSRLAGVPEIAATAVPDAIPDLRFPTEAADALLTAFKRDGAQNALPVQIADQRVRSAELNYKIARVRLLPKFSASLNHSLESTTNVGADRVSQTGTVRDSVEVKGSWPIFDGFATKGAKLEAMADRRLWERNKQIAADAAIDEAQRLHDHLPIDAAEMSIAGQRRAGADGGVKKAEEEVKAGNASPNTVQAATVDLRFAEINEAMVRANFLSDWSAFVSLVADDPALTNLPFNHGRATR